VANDKERSRGPRTQVLLAHQSEYEMKLGFETDAKSEKMGCKNSMKNNERGASQK